MTGQSPKREQIRNTASVKEDWAAVGEAVSGRMRELKLSTARLARETGLSETTIRYIGQPGTSHNKSTLVAISAALRWRYDYLTNILRREPHKNVRIRPTLLETLNAEVVGLKSTVREIDKKIDALLKHSRREQIRDDSV
jgi:hypothetical protein